MKNSHPINPRKQHKEIWLLKDKQSQRKELSQEKEVKKESKNLTKEIVHNKLFIVKSKREKYDRKKDNGIQCHFKNGKIGRKHDKYKRYRNKIHHR